ncbi:hypothetical protein V6N12_040065 [Hibiscus sabdariffa]|uniref:Uncharacterized protein n=1 Tax=Hibiscus sabdariffa TaxID=183260 RepID=A0ABR2E681_9ROSI
MGTRVDSTIRTNRQAFANRGASFSDQFSSSLLWLLPVLPFIHLFSLSIYSARSLDLFFNNHFRIESKINKMPWSFVNRARLVVFFLVIL